MRCSRLHGSAPSSTWRPRLRRHEEQMDSFHRWRPCPGKNWGKTVGLSKSFWNGLFSQPGPILRWTRAGIGLIWRGGGGLKRQALKWFQTEGDTGIFPQTIGGKIYAFFTSRHANCLRWNGTSLKMSMIRLLYSRLAGGPFAWGKSLLITPGHVFHAFNNLVD